MARTKQTTSKKRALLHVGAAAAAASGAGKKKSPVGKQKAAKKPGSGIKHKRPGGGGGGGTPKHHKPKNNSSNYGPISVQQHHQQPRGTKWNLSASMGGDSSSSGKTNKKKKTNNNNNNNNRRNILNSRANHSSSSSSYNNNKSSQTFVLNMPVVSHSDPVVPWLLLNQQRGVGGGVRQSPSKQHQQQSSNTTTTNNNNTNTNNNGLRLLAQHKALAFPAASLEKLNLELEGFADYVRLNETEIASRRSLVEQIQTHCRQLFGISSECCQVFGSFASLPVCTFSSDVDLAIHNVVVVEKAEAPLAAAAAAHNRAENESDQVVDADATPRRATKRIKTTEPSSLPQHQPHPNLKRQERVLKWKALIEEAAEDEDEKKQQATINSDGNQQGGKGTILSTDTTTLVIQENEAVEISSTTKNDKPLPMMIQTTPTTTTTTTSTKRQELAESRELPVTAEPSQDGAPLFVIDREGCPDDDNRNEEEDDVAAAAAALTDDITVPTVTDISKDPSILDDDDDDDGEEEEAETTSEPTSEDVDTAEDGKNNVNVTKRVHAEQGDSAKRLEDSGDEESYRGSGGNNGGGDDDNDESDADSADKLAALKNRKTTGASTGVPERSFRATPDPEASAQNDEDGDGDDDEEGEQDEKLKVENRPRSRSIISLCSATTCSDTEEKEWDDSGMEVSFVLSKTSTSRSRKAELPASIGPTGETRVKVVRALNALSRRLRREGLTDQVHVRKWAKVPIINMETHSGYECDIAIGGHNGTDTSSYASSQCSRFKSFPIVVLVLKILLNQHGLDKPFTGGLGSFKLYVLVASHIEQHLQLGGDDNAAEMFVTFLFRYGKAMQGHRNESERKFVTHLSQNSVVESGGRGFATGTADMGGVYKLDSCIHVFQACFFKLRDKLLKFSTDPSHSILGYIIDSQWLKTERQNCQRKLPPLSSYRNSSAIPSGLPFNWTENSTPHQGAAGGNKRKAEAMLKSHRASSNKQQSGQKRSNHQISSPNRGDETMDTDEEAEQLKAGYGLGAASRTPSKKRARSSTKKKARMGKKQK